MSTVTIRQRQSVASRRLGYAVAVGVNSLLFYLVNVSPGWAVLPFLSPATTEILASVNAMLIAGVAANVVYAAWDPRWFKALGDVVTTSIGLAAMLRVWQVFPFDFGESSIDWTTVARVALAVGIGGSAVALLVAVVTFFRSVSSSRR
ncbi:MAG: hypothetical protein L0H79_20390 [Intrasporangium sp.]|uniref:hypothetical protein n=1 Tax=Intrasporangium sp. TaxID=1925024 RepID=UPI00264741D3|nr:hypothetical protein [Intrasporangium sp.]MDN5798085.1 hypothetical protein [Intrasporangium sp.]